MDHIIAILLTLGAIYLINKYLFSYWTRRNFPQIEPSFFIGNLGSTLTVKQSLGDLFADFYVKFKSQKFIGAYFFYRPVLIINDPELIQDIMIKNFNSFHDRPIPDDAAKKYPLVGHLFNLRGQKWRDLRVKLSPTFTSGKLKAIFPIINECAEVLHKYIEKNLENGVEVFEFRDLFARFTTNIISSVAFGIENDSINDRENIFRKMGMKLFEPSLRNILVNMLIFVSPDLFVKSGIDPFGKELTNFMYSIVKQTIDHREKNKIERNDFMQLLIKLKNDGYIPVDKNDKDELQNYDEEKKLSKLTIDELTANVLLFFVAGNFYNKDSIFLFKYFF